MDFTIYILKPSTKGDKNPFVMVLLYNTCIVQVHVTVLECWQNYLLDLKINEGQ